MYTFTHSRINHATLHKTNYAKDKLCASCIFNIKNKEWQKLEVIRHWEDALVIEHPFYKCRRPDFVRDAHSAGFCDLAACWLEVGSFIEQS